jgi:cell division protein FtsQ
MIGQSEYAVTNNAREHHASKVTALKILVFVLCFFLIFEVAVYFVIMPGLEQVKISYNGIHRYTSLTFEYLLGANGKNNWLHFDAAAAASAISSFSGIESVSVEKHFPDSVIITVEERIPVAMTLTTIDNRTVPVMVDKNGIIFPMETIKTDIELPLVTGLPLENFSSGIRLDKMYHPIFAQIASLQSFTQKYFAALSEIHILVKEYGNYEFVLYPINSKIRVLMDRNLNEEALQYMLVMLDVVNTIKPDVKEIDLRYGSASYRRVTLENPAVIANSDAGGSFER